MLEAEFRSGIVYRFFLVPESTYDGLMAAESKGRYFNDVIRGRFAYERVRP